MHPEAVAGRLLDGALPSQEVSSHFDFSVVALRRSMRKMAHRAPGTDGFTATMFLTLPHCWWIAFASLWQHIMERGDVPSVWCKSSVALVLRPAEGFRPLGVAVVAWRCGARLICGVGLGW